MNTPADSMHTAHSSSPNGLAITLGLAGLLPFVALALVIVFNGQWRSFAAGMLMTYGAVIVSFLGGIH